ncbi:TonB-dependent receptor plug domain-containing protein [Sphingomonas jejuensis]|uniref:TonB-dependent receptor plug domain-containing protein n=1 Tax=Sphingomonas jejuensis TaxID=904715 RepID=UPI001439FA35|nr:TonB-dependent receptor [Sphingomonas jejuensis]
MTTKLLMGAALPLALAAPAFAQETATVGQDARTADAPAEGETPAASDIIVTGTIAFRNRTTDPNPVLSYDLDYFQRFEPVSVGEMLKRVPGVTFTSDVLEYDGVQFRGLPPGYTQVLINGRRAPGGEADRSFFVDRIPAELVERIEIVRSPRADQPSEGVAGTLNIVTKESTTFEGGFAKAAALINQDGELRPSFAGAYSGRLGERTSLWGALNYQERRNPKEKVSLRYDGLPEAGGGIDDPAFSNTELQDDTRDGSDLSGSAELRHEFAGGGFVRVQGFFVDTDREEFERSVTLDGADLDFDGVETQIEDIDQQTYTISGDAGVPLGGGLELGLAASWSGYREDTTATTFVGENEDDLDDLELDDEERLEIRDDEYGGTVSLAYALGSARVKAGIDLLRKDRDGLNDGDFLSGAFRVREDRYDPYVRFTFDPLPDLSVDAGLRYEITRRTVAGEDVGEVRYEAETLNPSLHLRFAPTVADQFRLSVARTVRRPGYDLVSPLEQEESPGDDDTTLGNPALRNERAWGVDAGYERRLGAGILGVNLFYRAVDDLIELVSLGENPENEDGQLFTPQNIGDGETWGVEVDVSVPLTFAGLPDTGIFANYTYLDSSVTDPFTEQDRRFNNQPHHIYNAGFIQTLRAADASFGATVSGRSDARESNFDEIVDLRYGADLEAFVEKRFGERFVLRFSVQDILRRSKREDFRTFDGDSLGEILANRAAGEIDEFEQERERAGPLYQVTMRAAF